MKSLLIIAVLLLGITKPYSEISVNLIELNHIRNDTTSFDQIIFWKEYPSNGLCKTELRAIGFQVIGTNELAPFIHKKNGYYKVQHKVQTDNGYYPITVVSQLYRESWSMTDPERESVRKHWNGNCPDFFREQKIFSDEQQP